MGDKIKDGVSSSERLNTFVARNDELATKKSKSGQSTERRLAREKDFQKKIVGGISGTPPLPKNLRVDKSQAVKMPDWMKGPRPTMSEIMRESNERLALPSTDKEWAELKEELDQVEFEVFGNRSR